MACDGLHGMISARQQDDACSALWLQLARLVLVPKPGCFAPLSDTESTLDGFTDMLVA